MGSVKTLLTADEFLQMPPQDDKRFELDEGELIEVTFPNVRHNRIVLRLLLKLSDFLAAHPLGEVFPSDTGFRLSSSTVRGPDVTFQRTRRVESLDPETNFQDGAADLTIEVVSPSDTARNLQRKVDQYLEAGGHTVWVMYPDTREVHAFTADGSIRRFKADDTLEAPELLSGLSLVVSELFE